MMCRILKKRLNDLKGMLIRMPPLQRARWLGTFVPGVLTLIYIPVMISWLMMMSPVMSGEVTMDIVMTSSQLTAYVMTMWLGLTIAFLIWISVKIFGNRKERIEMEEEYDEEEKCL